MTTQTLTKMHEMKLHGMAANYPEVAAQARHTEFSPEAFLGQLLRAEQAERTVRSMAYQMGAARFPAHRDLAGFEFSQAGVDEALVRTLHGGQFIDAAHNVVLIGGPGTGKTHLATAIGIEAIQKHGKRVRFFSTVELVNALELEKIGRDYPEFDRIFANIGNPTVAQGSVIYRTVDWEQRERSTLDMARELQPKVGALPGVNAFLITPPSLGQGFRSRPLTYVIQTSDSYENLNAVTRQMLAEMAKNDPVISRLESLPGIGWVTATAMRASIGDIQRFKDGRVLASWLGFTPKEHSSGSTRTLGRMSKRGDVYCRTLLIQGARAVLAAAKRAQVAGKPMDRLRSWAIALAERRGFNKAAVALANKLARIVCAAVRKGR